MILNIVGPPVRGEDLYGREEFITLLWDKLRKTNVLLAAPRRFGKTSIMYHLLDYPRNGYKIIHLDLEKITEPVNFIIELLDKINQDGKLAALVKKGFNKAGSFFQKYIKSVGAGLGGIEFKIELKNKIKDNWQDFANKVFSELKECPEKVIFIFDELALMLENFEENQITPAEQKAFMYWFRDFRQNPTLGLKNCRFLLGSSISIEQVLATMKISASINDFERIVLPELTHTQSMELINALFEGEKVALADSSKKLILKHIGPGVPYFIQVFVSEVSKTAKIKKQKITPSIIDKIYEEDVLGVNCKHYFIHYHERLRHYGQNQHLAQLFLRQLCLNDSISKELLKNIFTQEIGKFEIDRFNRILGDLENDFYIKYDPKKESYYFATNILKDWWKRYYAL